MKAMAIDYGESRTGVAISDPTGFISGRVFTLEIKDVEELINRLSEISLEEKVDFLVVGNPINMNGTIGERSEKCQEVGEMLRKKCSAEIILVDERMTTNMAYSYLRAGGKNAKKGKKEVDAVAASIILQSFLDSKLFQSKP